jgi:hypothetical protein
MCPNTVDFSTDGNAARELKPSRNVKGSGPMRKPMIYGGALVVLAAFACVLAGSAVARTLAAPTITNFTPKSGVPGSKVTMVGTNLAGAKVDFNGAPASAVTVNKWGNALVATVPIDQDALPIGSNIQITVTTPGGSTMSAASFMVTTGTAHAKPLKPQISSFAPMRGKAGVHVTIRGANLGGAQWVKFGGVKATYTVPSTTKIVAIVPHQAHSGKITVRTASGLATSSARLNFTVLPGM